MYLLLNVVFFVDATEGWEYYLGLFYVLFNVLIIWCAYRWPTYAHADETTPEPSRPTWASNAWRLMALVNPRSRSGAIAVGARLLDGGLPL